MEPNEMRERLEAITAEVGELAELESLTEEQAETLEARKAEFTTIKEQADRAAEIRRIQESAAEIGGMLPGDNSDPVEAPEPTRGADPYDLRGVSSRDSDELRSRALSAIEDMPVPARLRKDKAGDIQQRMTMLVEEGNATVAEHILLTSNPAYVGAFNKFAAGREFLMTDAEKRAYNAVEAYRALTISDGAGVLAPAFIDPTIILSNTGTNNSFRQISRNVTTTTNTWNGVTSDGVTASWDAEAAEVSDDAPSFTQPTITCYKGQAFVPISFEAYEDQPGLGTEVARMFADAKDRLEGTAFATGSGSAQPFGVVAAVAATAGSRVAATTNDSYGLVDVYAVANDLPARWEEDSSTAWVANKAIINLTRQFATSDNYHGFMVDLAPGSTGRFGRTMLGYPLYSSSDMDSALGTTDDDILILGAFDQYVIVDRIGASVEFIPNLFHTTTNLPSGQRGWLMHWRVGADSILDDAFRVLRV
jgi:HK97 family phage major capsid protein